MLLYANAIINRLLLLGIIATVFLIIILSLSNNTVYFFDQCRYSIPLPISHHKLKQKIRYESFQDRSFKNKVSSSFFTYIDSRAITISRYIAPLI